jgi:hypothetical protein
LKRHVKLQSSRVENILTFRGLIFEVYFYNVIR